MIITRSEREALLKLEVMARDALKAVFKIAPLDPAVMQAWNDLDDARCIIAGAKVVPDDDMTVKSGNA